MDAKKISFGFSKISKKLNLLPNSKEKQKDEAKVELIQCFEGHKIKLVEEKPIEAPLVIPLKDGQKTSAAIASLIKRRAVLLGEPEEGPVARAPSPTNHNGNIIAEETLEQRAARELLAQSQQNGLDANNTISNQVLVLPALKADELPLDGATESTMDDYESIPIQQFGLAMLRGMGWTEPPKQQKARDGTTDDMPLVRPKGMGLGADKALKAKPLLVPPEKNEVLEIKKHAYVRILGGKYKDMYGQIEGFDDYAARVIIKLAIGGSKEAFNEFLCQPVTKKEYLEYGKCINTAKYEEYKKMENEHGQIIKKTEHIDKKPQVKKEERVGTKVQHQRSQDHEEKPGTSNYKDYKAEHGDRKRQDRTRNKDELFENYHRRRRAEEEEHTKRRERNDDKRYQGSRRLDTHDREETERNSREREREHSDSFEIRMPSTSSSTRRQPYTDDTSASSGTDSDSDSAYERKHKKKSNHTKSKAKKKSSKKSKHRKQKHRHNYDETDSSDDSSSSDDTRLRKHKKKTKKSKKPRSRSRSHARTSK